MCRIKLTDGSTIRTYSSQEYMWKTIQENTNEDITWMQVTRAIKFLGVNINSYKMIINSSQIVKIY